MAPCRARETLPCRSMKKATSALRAEFKATRICVLLDGKAYVELDDNHIAGPGAVGVWTKADSVTAFDDFTYQPAP